MTLSNIIWISSLKIGKYTCQQIQVLIFQKEQDLKTLPDSEDREDPNLLR